MISPTGRGLLLGLLTAALLGPSSMAPVAAQEVIPDEEDNPFFVLDDFDPEPSPWEFRGGIDLTLIQFEDSQNLDEFPRLRLTPLEPSLRVRYRPGPEIDFITEVEYEGVENEWELDQLAIRLFPEGKIGGAAGVQYIPFGIERYFAAPSRNPLVDRPSPLRRVFPGTYSDLGFFGTWTDEIGAGLEGGLEVAITRGLTGPDREDRNDLFDPIEGIQPTGRVHVGRSRRWECGVSGLATRFDDPTGGGRRSLWLVGLDLTWRPGGWIIRAEGVFGSVERAESGGGNYDRYGWYLEVYRRLPKILPWGDAIEVVARYDDVDEDDSVRDFRDVRRLALGLNWVIDASWRLKTEVLIAREDGEQIANDGRFVQLEYHF